MLKSFFNQFGKKEDPLADYSAVLTDMHSHLIPGIDDGASTTVLGSSGSIVSYSLDDAYNDGSNIAVDTGAVAFGGASDGAINIIEVTLAGAGTGNMIDIQNDTTGTAGFDIEGTDDSWF